MKNRVSAMFREILLWILLFATGGALLAQSYPTHVYTQDDGLPALIIESIEQTPDGVIWLASRVGVTSYDGVNWETQAGELPGAKPYLLLETDAAGRLWAVAADSSIAYLEDGRWNAFPPLDLLPEESNDRAVRFTVETDQRKRPVGLFVTTLMWRFFRWSETTGWYRETVEESGASLIYDAKVFNGNLYVATEKGVWTEQEDGFEKVDLPEGIVYAMAVVDRKVKEEKSTSDELLILGESWVGSLSSDSHDPQGVPIFSFLSDTLEPIPHPQRTICLIEDGLGGVLFGNPEFGRRVTSDGHREAVGRISGLSNDGITDLLKDREGNLWIAGMRGLNKILHFRSSTWNHQHGLLGNEVTAVLELGSGTFLLGHNRGVVLLDPDRNTPESQILWRLPFSSIPEVGEETPMKNTRVLDLAEDRNGDLWIAAAQLGLLKVDSEGRVQKRWNLSEPVAGLVIDEDDTLWMATRRKIYRMTDGRPVFDREIRRGARRLFLGKEKNTLYGALEEGLLKISLEGDTELFRAPPQESNVYSLLEEEDHFFVGTNAGLFELRDGALQRPESPTISRPIYFLLRDHLERLWMGTDYGAYIWDGEKLQSYTARDGLGGTEANRAAGILDSKKRIWVGTESGVTVIQPWQTPQAPPPIVEIEKIEVGGKIFTPHEDIRLENQQNNLTIHYRALSFRDERRVRFRAWLEGFDKEALELAPRLIRRIRYTNLSPGTYRFHLQAAAHNGPWSTAVQSSPIYIAPPFWAQTWFLSLLVLLTAAAAILIRRDLVQRRHIAREMTRNQRLESLGRLAGGLAHDFNNLLTAIIGQISLTELRLLQQQTENTSNSAAVQAAPPEIKDREKILEHLAKTRIAAERAGQLTRQLVTFARGGVPVRQLSPLREIIQDTVGGALAGSRIQAEVRIAANLLGAEIDAGQIRQALHNLVTYSMDASSPDGEILVRATNLLEEDREPRVLIEVIDAGEGIPEEDLDRIFEPYFAKLSKGRGLGIAATYSIIRAHGGEIWVDSVAGFGSHFSITLPAKEVQEIPQGSDEIPMRGDRIVKVLLMDDEEMVREVLTKALLGLGYEVTATGRGEEAINAYREALGGVSFDVVLLDLIVAEGMGGRETIEELLRIDPEVRAIVCSGYSHDPIMAEHREYGFRGVLPKPFRVSQLDEALHLVLEDSASSVRKRAS